MATKFNVGDWLHQQTGKGMETFAVVTGQLKNGGYKAISINTVFTKAKKQSTRDWYPEPTLIDEKDIPEKLKAKIIELFKKGVER